MYSLYYARDGIFFARAELTEGGVAGCKNVDTQMGYEPKNDRTNITIFTFIKNA